MAVSQISPVLEIWLASRTRAMTAIRRMGARTAAAFAWSKIKTFEQRFGGVEARERGRGWFGTLAEDRVVDECGECRGRGDGRCGGRDMLGG